IILELIVRCLSFVLVSFLFFFSSRRRHTRCYRDWSSDVCSSDLSWTALIQQPEGSVHFAGEHASSAPGWMQGALESGLRATRERSEERRVGKECSCRGSVDDGKKKGRTRRVCR